MYNNFIQRLKAIKRELLDLKTAHERGLGSASFFSEIAQYSYTSVGGSATYLVINIAFDSELLNVPYCQCYISNAQYFNPASISVNNNTISYMFECYVNNVTIDGDIKVIAGAPIQSVNVGAL